MDIMWYSGMKNKEKRDQKDETWRPGNIWGLGGTMASIFLFVTLMKIAEKSPGEATAIMGILAGVAMLVVPFWLYFRYKTQVQQGAQKVVENPKEEAKMHRLEERMENLEALICRLDSELNQQMEKSLVLARNSSSFAAAEASQMPTSILSVASALENRFQVLQEIGRGGMGVVFQAYDKQLREQVAIKVLSPMLSGDPEALERLKREVSAARRVTHSNVIRIHDISEANQLYYVSMEFFSGRSLKEYLRQNGALSTMHAFQIVSQICDGLEAAHQQGVIHRDLKSQNIIINNSNQIKIIDFGLARTAHLDGMTVTGLIMGTPEYMAPEQVSGKKVDERADIYSLGVILFEIFTGKLPFTGESAISVGFKQIKDDPPSPRSIVGKLKTPEPPGPKTGPPLLFAMMSPEAPAVSAFAAFVTKVQVPRSTIAILPSTAAAFTNGSQPSLAVPAPPPSFTRMTSPTKFAVVGGGPNDALPDG